MKNIKQVLLFVTLLVLLVGVVSATEVSNDTAVAAYDEVADDISDTTLTDTNVIVDEVVQDTSIVTEEVQEKSIKDNRIIKNNIRNVKSESKTYEVNNYDDFRTALSGRDFGSVTINIKSDITLTNSLTISTDIYSLNINGKGHTINGNNQYSFLTKSSAVNVEMNNIEIVNCKDAIKLQQGSLTITDSKLNNNQGSDGGAIKVGVSLTLKNCTLNNNKAANGGAIYVSCDGIYESIHVTIINTTINNNNAIDGAGGAIFVADSIYETSIVITNSTLNNNSAKTRSGTVNIGTIYGTVTITNSILNNNSVNSGSGVLCVDNSPVTITNCTLNNNKGSTGGAISTALIAAPLNITDSQLCDNYATESGGVIYSKDGVLSIRNSTLNNNMADQYGGSVYLEDFEYEPYIPVITNCTLNNNHAKFGGALSIKSWGHFFRIMDTIFNNNTATDQGGAIFIDTGTIMTLKNCTLNNNGAGQYGGGICQASGGTVEIGIGEIQDEHVIIEVKTYWDGEPFTFNVACILNIMDSTLNNNTAGQYGGAIISTGYLIINNTILNNNNATGYGGAVTVYYDYNLTLINSTINNNIANKGGALYTRGNSSIIDTEIENNHAKQSGGAIYYQYYYENTHLNITDSIISSNYAEMDGGAIYNDAVTNIIGTALKKNHAKQSGGAIENKRNLTITDTAIYNNNAEQYGGAIDNKGNMTITGTTLYNNNATEYGGAIYNNGTSYEISNTLFYNNNPANFIINNETNKIEFEESDGYLTVGDFSIMVNGETIGMGTGTNDLNNYIITKEDNIKITVNGTDSKTVNNDYIFRTSEMNIRTYQELIDAIENARNEEYSNYVINLLPGNYDATQSIDWNNSATRNIKINGNGLTLNGQNTHQFIKIAQGHNLTLENITLTNYKATNGGAIENYGISTINNTTLNQNKASEFGGAVFNENGATLIITQSKLTKNIANYGGAIDNHGNLTINDTILMENYAENEGGAIRDVITKSIISNTVSFRNNPENFIINNVNKIQLKSADYITINEYSIIVDGEVKATGNSESDLFNEDYTIPIESNNVEIIINGTESKTINNRYILRNRMEKNITNYSELIETIKEAQNEGHTEYTINLLPGDYHAIESMDLKNSETRNIKINGNGLTLNGQGTYQFIKIGQEINLTLENIILKNYNATNGGSIENYGNLIITNTTLQSNRARTGGAIDNHGNLTINNTTLQNNRAETGGAIDNRGNLSITNTTLNYNQASESGGAICNNANLIIKNVTFMKNNAIYGGAINNHGTSAITNSEFTFNNASEAGAIYNDGYLNIKNTILMKNSATDVGAIRNYGNLILNNSIVYNNTATSEGAISTHYTTVNYIDTVFERNTPQYFYINETNRICEEISFKVDTFSIIEDGIEIGSGTDSEDIGNYLIYGDDVRLIVNSTNSKNTVFILKTPEINIESYRELINVFREVQNEEYSHYVINLMPGDYNATESIDWNNSLTRNIKINGNGLTLDGKDRYQFIKIADGYNLTLENIALTNYNATNGGAIENYGNLSINNSTLTKNNAEQEGGAICNNGNLNITHSTLNNNTAEDGGSIRNHQNLTIKYSTLSNNVASSAGGTIYTSKNLNIAHSTLNNNRASWRGGSIFNYYGVVYINNSTLNHSRAATGGAIDSLGDVAIINTTLSNNIAGGSGGAILSSFDSTLVITDSILTKNTGSSGGAISNMGNIIINNSIIMDSKGENGPIYDSMIAHADNNYEIGRIINTVFYRNEYESFIINEENKIELRRHYDYVSITGYSIIVDGEVKATGYSESDLDNEDYTVPIESNYVEIIINGTGSKTINNRYILRNRTVKNINNYSELIEAIAEAENCAYTSYIINLLSGNYNATESMDLNNSETRNITIKGNGLTLDGQNSYQFIKIADGYNLTLENVTLTNYNATYGGAIENYGTLIIQNVSLISNNAEQEGGAIYNNGTLTIINSTLNNNTATSGGAITSKDGTANIRCNIFTDNTAQDGETLCIHSENTLEENTYRSTDVAFKTVNLMLKDNQDSFIWGEDVILNFTLELSHPEYYDSDILEKIDLSVYINGVENCTTKYVNYTLLHPKTGVYTVNFVTLHNTSNSVHFRVNVVSEISTHETSIDYYSGLNSNVTLNITDTSGEKGTVDINVKENDGYKKLLSYYYVNDGYTIPVETLKVALENIYDELDGAYVFNLTYYSDNVFTSSTEFTLNIIKQRNTSIIYDIINNTEGNVQINITVTDTVGKTPINDATIKITGDINRNTTSGIITDTTLTPGSYTISVLYVESENYKSSEATINFDVEIDKDKKIEELGELVENLNDTINDLNDTIQTQNSIIQDLQEQIDELKAPKETTLTIDEITDVKYGDEIAITGILVNEDGFSLSNQNITIKFKNEEKTVTTRNGEFRYTTTATIIGENTVTATYAGNDKNKESEATYTFEVAKADTTITITPIEAVKKGESVTIMGTLVDHNGNALANSVVRLLINNGRKTLKTDADGVYTFDYALTRIGENTITAIYEGSDFYNEATESITVEVKPLATTIVIDPMDSVTKGTKATITGTLTDENGDAVANAVVKLSINGSNKTLRTDADGKFTHTYTMNKVGENTITAAFAGTANYEATETATTLEVTKGESVITIDPVENAVKGSNVTFTGKLTDANGVAIANAQVKIMINGSPKTLKTDANGVFSHIFKITKEGVNYITAIFNGNNDYLATETDTTFEVIEKTG